MRSRALILSFCCAAVLTLRGAASEAPLPAASRHPGGASPVAAARGIAWETSLAAAQVKARRTGKPLFLLHLFGKLNEPFC